MPQSMVKLDCQYKTLKPTEGLSESIRPNLESASWRKARRKKILPADFSGNITPPIVGKRGEPGNPAAIRGYFKRCCLCL
ncbi:MAG: hypothetical protein AAFS12_07300 [Cyanobacteria bacterium J06632_19]